MIINYKWKNLLTESNSINNSFSERYRHEFKYEIDAFQFEILKSKLCSIMMLDSHASSQQEYMVRSLYFDDWQNSCYYENENGTEPREKYRIRIYNGSADYIVLECKRKEAGKTLKKSCPVSYEQAADIISNGRLYWDDKMDPIMKKLYILQETRAMSPKVIVEYKRIPFIYRDGNVRIALDSNICTSTDIENFFNPIIECRPIMPIGKHILEVKYDSFIPDHIYNSVEMKGLQQITFSKYYLCRKFGGLL